MGYAQDLVNAGYTGYQGWDDAGAAADFKATGGSGKENRSGGGGGGFQPISAPDFDKLEQQSFELLKPYYLQLAKEAQGDFNRATQILEEDYTTGSRQATEDHLRKTAQTQEDLKSSMESLGLSNQSENEAKIDSLNRRGMAVYQENPDGTPNVVGGGGSQENLGRGGVELGRLAQDQSLRQQALQRSADRMISESGIAKSRITNTGGVDTTGMTPAQSATALSAPGVDRSKLGQSELGLIRGQEQNTRNYQQTTQGLANDYTQQGLGIASSVAGAQQREIPEALKQQYLKNSVTDFVQKGIT